MMSVQDMFINPRGSKELREKVGLNVFHGAHLCIVPPTYSPFHAEALFPILHTDTDLTDLLLVCLLGKYLQFAPFCSLPTADISLLVTLRLTNVWLSLHPQRSVDYLHLPNILFDYYWVFHLLQAAFSFPILLALIR